MKSILFFILTTMTLNIYSQTIIKGKVTNKKDNPLIGSNVYIKGTYNGTTTDTSGYFKLSIQKTDSAVIVISYLGYERIEQIINSNSFHIKLKESNNSLNQVVVTAGTFEAGDRKRSVLLNSRDILTTANTEGDIFGAIETLPGVQREITTGKIIVRGGDSHESKTYIDGLLVSSPYTSNLPDIPSRSRFSPFHFNGTMFCSGGYSAEYGQALSSVLSLKTNALADETQTSISLLNVGAMLGHTHRLDKSSITAEANYSNLQPYFKMASHNLDWIKVPESLSGQLRYRHKIGQEGMLKSFVTYTHSNSILNYKDNMNDLPDRLSMLNNNIFGKTSFNTKINSKWMLLSGISYNHNIETYDLSDYSLRNKLQSSHTKLVLSNNTSDRLTMKYGTDVLIINNVSEHIDKAENREYLPGYTDMLVSSFVESDIKINHSIALRVGGRGEYSSYTNHANIAPRLSLAYKLSKKHLFSLAYGNFYQQVDREYLNYSNEFQPENAVHYIANYQFSPADRFLRIEGYYKQYNNLIKFSEGDDFGYTELSNDGYGTARGIDIFFRDKKTFDYGDFWISYSFLDTKRNYKDYSQMATPKFASKHNVSVVFKYWVPALHTQISGSYRFRSGKPYHDPNSDGFLSKKTKPFNDFSMSLSHVTNIFGQHTVVHASCKNIFGFNNVIGYRFDNESNDQGIYESYIVKPFAKRTIVLGIFISIK